MIQTKLTLLMILIGMGVILSSSPAFGQTQKDMLDIRGHLIRIEEGQKALNQKIDELDKRLNGRIDELDKRLNGRMDELDKRFSGKIDGLEKRMDYLVHLIYVVLAGMFTLVGFVLWDRRSALAPAIRRTRDLEEREERLERAIKEFALKNPDMKEILKNLGLL